MTHELGPGRRFKSQLGEWYERDQVAAEVARAVEAERAKHAGLLEALRMWLHLHDTPAGYAGKWGKALDAAIAAQQVKVDAAAQAARAAIARAEGAQAHGQTPGSQG